MTTKQVPNVVFKTRVRDDSIAGPNPYRWQDVSTDDLFANKRVIVFSLPGAFTPTCSTFQLPDFEALYPQFQALNIDAIYCISVNDAFVMNAWAKDQGVKNVQMIPDGNGTFTRQMGMLVAKDNLGFGFRSWRYAMLVDNGYIIDFWQERGYCHYADNDPYEVSSPQVILDVLSNYDQVFIPVRTHCESEDC